MRYKVLFIVGGFKDGGGTIRVEKLLKYLPLSSFKGVVLTKKINKSSFYEICEGTSVYRTKALDLGKIFQKIKYIFKTVRISSPHDMSATNFITNQRLSDKLLIPDSDIFWAINAIFSVNKIILRESIDIFYSSSPHASSHLVALLYRKLYNSKIPWVVEFRDPWTFNPFVNKKPFLLEFLNNYLEKIVIKSCSKIIVTSLVYKNQFLKKYKFLEPSKIVFIPNGYDSDDFIDLVEKKRNSKLVTIVHAGEFYGKRTILHFLTALNQFFHEYPNLAKNLRVLQFGSLDPLGKGYNEKYPNPIFQVRCALPHKKCLEILKNADWLLLIPGPGSGTIPGKFYEYLAIDKPILCLADEGPMIEYFSNNKLGFITNSLNVLSIKRALIRITESQREFENFSIDSEFKNQFDRKYISEKVSHELNLLLNNLK